VASPVRWPRLGPWLLRLGAAALLLWLVVRLALPADGPGVLAALRSAWVVPLPEALGDFALAATLFGAAFVVGAERFRALLEAAGFTTRRGALLRAYVVGGFFNLVLPGAMMGDVYRFVDARRESGSGSAALGVLVVERLLGLAALGGVALLAVPAIPAGGRVEGFALAPWLVGLGASLFLAPVLPLYPRANAWLAARAPQLARVSPRAADAAARALEAVRELARRPVVVAAAFGWSLLSQGLPVAAVWVLSWSLDADVAGHWYLVIVPIVTLASMLPISLGGTGVREALYVALFGGLGMRPEVALSLSLSTLAVALVWGLVGLGLFLVGARPGPPAAEGAA